MPNHLFRLPRFEGGLFMSHHGKLPSFQLLWNGYPDFPDKSEKENARAVRKLIGGACDNEDYLNTCAMRLTRRPAVRRDHVAS